MLRNVLFGEARGASWVEITEQEPLLERITCCKHVALTRTMASSTLVLQHPAKPSRSVFYHPAGRRHSRGVLKPTTLSLMPCVAGSQCPQHWAGLRPPGRCRHGTGGALWGVHLRAASGGCHPAHRHIRQLLSLYLGWLGVCLSGRTHLDACRSLEHVGSGSRGSAVAAGVDRDELCQARLGWGCRSARHCMCSS